MAFPFVLPPLWCRGLLAFAAFLVSLPALAGDISFRLSLTGSTLAVTLLGETPAFYPAVLRLLPDGRWERLVPKSGSIVPAELLPGKQFELEWPDTRPLQSLTPFESLQPLMVRYFERDGVSFGQIAFFQPPPVVTEENLKAGYADGSLVIAPPAAASNPLHATWVLWPQEEGSAPIHNPLRFDHVQPPAQRVEWHSGAITLNTGKGQPDTVLLHETAQGYFQQTVAGGLQGQAPRASWIGASSKFYGMAFLAALVAVIALLRYLVRGAWGNANL